MLHTPARGKLTPDRSARIEGDLKRTKRTSLSEKMGRHQKMHNYQKIHNKRPPLFGSIHSRVLLIANSSTLKQAEFDQPRRRTSPRGVLGGPVHGVLGQAGIAGEGVSAYQVLGQTVPKKMTRQKCSGTLAIPPGWGRPHCPLYGLGQILVAFPQQPSGTVLAGSDLPPSSQPAIWWFGH